MVKLVLDDVDQISFLEIELVEQGIEFKKISSGFHCKPLERPFLLVDGVPLDFSRAIKWIKGRCEHE